LPVYAGGTEQRSRREGDVDLGDLVLGQRGDLI
jgi:hypothetical protein